MSTSSYTLQRLARIRQATAAEPRKRPKTRKDLFVGLCCLCGAPAKRRYCHAHSWAEGN